MQTNDARRHRQSDLNAVLSDRCHILSQLNLPSLPAKRSARGAGGAPQQRVEHLAVAWPLVVRVKRKLSHVFSLLSVFPALNLKKQQHINM